MEILAEAWLQRAEADFATAEREFATPDHPNFEAVCFHAQQCALRYLKARLHETNLPYPNTTHLMVLLEVCLELEPDWVTFRDHLRMLNNASLHLQDPEVQPDVHLAEESLELVRAFRDGVRSTMGLTEP
jgi:HEPN domain-containing protein